MCLHFGTASTEPKRKPLQFQLENPRRGYLEPKRSLNFNLPANGFEAVDSTSTTTIPDQTFVKRRLKVEGQVKFRILKIAGSHPLIFQKVHVRILKSDSSHVENGSSHKSAPLKAVKCFFAFSLIFLFSSVCSPHLCVVEVYFVFSIL